MLNVVKMFQLNVVLLKLNVTVIGSRGKMMMML